MNGILEQFGRKVRKNE